MKTALTLTLLVATLALAGCTNRRDKEVIPYGFEGQDVHANWGPITTHPIVGRNKVPAGMTPTGDTGYAVANTSRTNGTIVNGTAAPCGVANNAGYNDGCAHAAGYGLATSPYR